MAVVPYSSSSSFVPNSYKYDVFISFRGEDTRYNFTSHLDAALRRSSIETYIDERSLERGDEISPSLLKAIEESQLSLVVFSQNYASSGWCLDELVHILKCKKENGQIAIPLFYHVDPSIIRHQRGSFGDAFVEHHKRFEHDRNKVEVWRNALKEAVNLSGFDSKDQPEAEFVENIVKDVQEKLKRISSIAAANDFKGLVGMTKRFHEIGPLLSIGSPDVRIVGIWGMGGIGKTTLANALCKRFSSIFDNCFFVTDVTDKQLYKLLKDGQLRRRKIFVVLDNVDDLQQLQHLLRIHNFPSDICRWFGVGSRIIITSRDKKLLTDVGADKIYEVKALDYDEALELLYMKAFKSGYARSAGYEGLAERVLDYAQGHPLTLEVLGSYLCGRSKKEWDDTLRKLRNFPDKRIHNVLKLSFDALDRVEKSIFLDIACFFNRRNRYFIESIHGDGAHIGISVLSERSLITVTKDLRQVIGMHGLIQEMGWEIASHEGSRFWITKDVLKVLKNNQGNDRIEGISLNMSELDEYLYLEPTVFQDMCNLRVLNIYNPSNFLYLSEKYSKLNLPNSLRYIQWDHCPLKTFPPKFRPECLVRLEMRYNQLMHLWNGVQPLGNLKHIDLAYSQLVKIPDLSLATRLERIDLTHCQSLVELPSIKFHNFDNEVQSLGTLVLYECTSLKVLPEISGDIGFLYLYGTGIKELPSSIRSCESLLKLQLSNCKDLESIPELPRNLEHLYLSETSIREMPATSIEFLHRVKCIEMKNCKRLESLPSNFCKLKALEILLLSGCSNLKSFPEIKEPMKHLSNVDLSKSGIQELPTSFENVIGLQILDMSECINLKNIPEDLHKLGCLFYLSFSGCVKLERFPNMLLGLISLRKLNLSFCNIFEIPTWIGDLTSLVVLHLRGNMFASIPHGIKQLPKLVKLDIRDCEKLQLLPELPLSVEIIIADRCTSLEDAPETSMSTFSQRRLDDFGYKLLEFMFRGCLKLNQNASNKIAMDFLCRIAYIYSIEKGMTSSESKLCYLGNRIPEWMRHQSEGFSKLTIKLPPNWRNSKFNGFVACAVLSFKELCMCVKDNLDICCTVYIKTKDGQSYSYDTFRSFSFVKEEQTEGIFRGSDHVFMWYVKFDGNYSDAVEMSVDFFCGHYYERNRFYSSKFEYSSTYEVKRCGVHMLCYIEEELIGKNNTGIKQCMDDTEQHGITMPMCQHVQPLQDASHNVTEEELSDNNDRNTAGPSRNCMMNHEESNDLKYFPLSSVFPDDDQTNMVEGDSEAIDNKPEASAAPVINSDAEESCFEIIKCFDFCSCSRLILDWIQGSRGN